MSEFSGLASPKRRVVVFDIERVGPLMECSTRTAQGDLSAAVEPDGDTRDLPLIPARPRTTRWPCRPSSGGKMARDACRRDERPRSGHDMWTTVAFVPGGLALSRQGAHRGQAARVGLWAGTGRDGDGIAVGARQRRPGDSTRVGDTATADTEKGQRGTSPTWTGSRGSSRPRRRWSRCCGHRPGRGHRHHRGMNEPSGRRGGRDQLREEAGGDVDLRLRADPSTRGRRVDPRPSAGVRRRAEP